MRATPELRAKAFQALYDSGWCDWPLAKVLNVGSETVRKWRTERGLPPNLARPKIDWALAEELYKGGASDGGIARQIGTHQTAVLKWRKREGLPPNSPKPAVTKAEVRKAKRLLRLGASMRQVSAEIGRSTTKTVQKIRHSMNDPCLRRTGVNNLSIRAKVLKDPQVQRRIERAVGTKLPLDVRLDAVSELYVDVLEGRCAVELIEQQAPSYRNRAYEMCGSRYGARSLDEEIGEGWTIGDTIADPSAFDELEAAADRILSNDNW